MSWGTADELFYLKNIGTFSAAGTRTSKLELYKLYRDHFFTRKSWGKVDENSVLQFVNDAITELTAKQMKRHHLI